MIAILLGAWLGLQGPAGAVSNPAVGTWSRFEFVETHMGSPFKLVLYSTDEAAARDASRHAYDRVAALDATLSDYQPESELSRLGEKAGGPMVPISADLLDVLRLSKRWYDRTGGVLDVTIAPVGRLWRRARRERKLPDPAKLAEARALVGADKLVLDPRHSRARLAKAGMRLDVGGIAKGYAAQAALDVLRARGVSRALVAAAGDIVVGDPPPDAPGWTIGIAGLNPHDEPPVLHVLLHNRAISTSGDAERFVVINGRRYSHIINPITGQAVEERASVTVVAPDGSTADALETSAYLLGPEKGLELIDAIDGAAAIYTRATPEGVKTYESSRFKDVLRTGPRPESPPAVSPSRSAAQASPHLPEASPESLGFDPDRLRRIDAAIERALSAGQVPGAVVLVGRHGKIAYARAAGLRVIEPQREAMTRDTVFDMASLTKPVATATAVMLLVEEGRIRLNDEIGHWLPEFNNHGKEAITIEHLLRHRGGLVADNSLKDYEAGPQRAWEAIAQQRLLAPPGRQFVYSDVGFMILGRLVERVSGQPLDRFTADRIFRPLGMRDTHFRPSSAKPPGDWPASDRIAPTEPARPGEPPLRGEVHDPRSRALGGVAGHAGLFATADDLATYAVSLLSSRLLGPLTVRTMIDPGSTPTGQRRGLGWDVASSYSSPRGSFFGPRSFGHTGFTGTSLWIDPETGVFVIVLTSRLHPDGKKSAPTELRSTIASLAAAAVTDAPVLGPSSADRAAVAADRTSRARPVPVECGIDVLRTEGFRPLRGKRVGLVTNHTGRTRSGRSTIDVLFQAPEVRLVRLFSPEHGIRGEVDAKVPDGKDPATGLPIVSLYGAKQKPEAADLADLDILAYDIQDIGVRYYTYSSTLGLVLEAAAAAGMPLVVLDRPNPIGGVAVAGPVRDPEFGSFIAYHALPVRHGMTSGELAQLYRGERTPNAKLDVVACRGWDREQTYDRTGLTWINPSPNMRSLAEALLYPGVGWLEATNLATGRGTDTPFERIGAPWIEPRAFAADLNAAGLSGVRFVPAWFTPKERQYQGERCGGVQIHITDWAGFEPLRLGLAMATTLRARYPKEWKPEGVRRMLADQASYEAILSGQGVEAIVALWAKELDEFRRVRSNYLIYPEGD